MGAEQASGPSQAEPWRPSAKQVLGAIAVLVVVVFAAVNLEERARIDFVFDHVRTRVFFAVAGPAVVGFAAGFLFGRRRTG